MAALSNRHYCRCDPSSLNFAFIPGAIALCLDIHPSRFREVADVAGLSFWSR